jgi:hypothetical protein
MSVPRPASNRQNFRGNPWQEEDVSCATWTSRLFRSAIGFDRMMDLLQNSMELGPSDSYPPYNIEKTNEDAYRITPTLWQAPAAKHIGHQQWFSSDEPPGRRYERMISNLAFSRASRAR